jgi:2-polyprenyl-3-methyl-5-hydroxy-6-metoxy-1,4-benzoquinol methylase
MKKGSSIQCCHVCGGELSEFTKFREFKLVSSDCQPITTHASLWICSQCGTVQKGISEEWQACVDQVYQQYNVYSQAAGKEQRAFDAAKGDSTSRSSKILEWIQSESSRHELKLTGSLLDFGCGNGSFLGEFHRLFPKWKLTGLEMDDSNQSTIESIPNTTHRAGPIDSLLETYDLISMVHVLEHLIDPISLLVQLRKKLRPGGTLFIEVPNLITSPFDLFILDHCTHFTLENLRWILWKSGFHVTDTSTEVVAKEISVMAVPLDQADGEVDVNRAEPSSAIEAITRHLNLARQLRAKGKDLIDTKPAIFGSSISGTWLASELDFNVSSFIDEDIDRVGNVHCSIPILSLDDVPPSLPVMLPFSEPTARSITARLNKDHPMIHTISALSNQ